MANLNNNTERDQWGSKVGFILAAAGSAVGLGNLWRFPVTAGQNGGGAFVLVYFAILILVGFTLMMAELVLGRHTQLNALGAYKKIRNNWAWVGGLGVLAGFLILSFYSVIGGWVINYMFKAITGAFTTSDPEFLGGMFGAFISNPVEPLFYHAIFMILTLGIVIGGVKGGIEKYAKILMPALFVMMVLTMLRSVTLPGAMEGIKFLLVPDFSMITGAVLLSALGQVFFSLSLGMGAMITYGSYLSKDANIPQSSFIIPLVDTGIALLAGLAILPAVFSFGFDPAEGPGLLFVTLPAVFSQMPLGGLFGFVFFLLVLFAALTSSISLLEVCVAYVVDEWNMTRKKATIGLAAVIFLLGIPSSLGIGVWSHISPFRGLDILDSVDFIASNVLMPVGGFLLCIFIGWVWGLENAIKEATNEGTIPFKLAGFWSFMIKWVAPIAIAVVFVQGILS
ncbi:sodium:neurotransmitter symporter [Alkaliphilus metalliredigens QYMF]|uniref:Sodium:neurotransmitter symporter n=1 Tax=Alkaliphilus metalliredigens (strain QYMF) TaxID=293826 RepID=A6TK27_ALKMQ|nr:sodium-dependent transporter [Alkaliphilus metalliredigens]ABR46545.1 sodium:neurotransmitter symporter [Alkaliphilus metalliredigens QYMF]